MSKRTAASLLALAASVVAGAAYADMVIDSVEMTRAGDNRMVPATSRRLWIGLDRFRLDMSITNISKPQIFTNNQLYFVDYADKSYSVMGKDEQSQNGQASGHATQATAANEPPAAREIKNTHRTERAANWPCEVWQVFEKNQLRQELCVVPLAKLPEMIMVGRTMDRYNKMIARQGGNAGNLPWSDVGATRGFPLITRNYSDGKLDNTSTATAILPLQDPPDVWYLVPPGFHERHEEGSADE
jgi:hypothetical protein